MKIIAVLFDLDGTLVDSNDFHVAAWEEAFLGHGFTIERAVIASQIGKGGDLLVPALLPETTKAVQKQLADNCGEIFKERYLARVRPFPGATALLSRVHDAGQRVAFASSASQAELEHYIELLDAGRLFDAMVTADDVEASKPAPDIFAAALVKLSQSDPAKAVMIGDTPYDIAGAAACGVPAIAVRSGGFPDSSLAEAIAIYDDVSALDMAYLQSPLAA